VQLSVVVLHGSDPRTLRRGPGHLEGTALPGESGNAVIAGHRDTFFRPLRDVRRGDDVFVTTPLGRLHYRVTSLRVVHPRDLRVLRPTRQATLTLITCYPFWVLGDAPDRYVVQATRVVAPAATPLATDALPLSESIRELSLTEHPVLPQSPAVPDTLDDEILVRQVVERYRLTYNALLARDDRIASEPLRFRRCEVSLTDGQAEASCEASSKGANGAEPQVRTFILQRAGEGWAIRSVLIKGV
jgi:LPXTG-site transpeptidase (sortase) family protein